MLKNTEEKREIQLLKENLKNYNIATKLLEIESEELLTGKMEMNIEKKNTIDVNLPTKIKIIFEQDIMGNIKHYILDEQNQKIEKENLMKKNNVYYSFLRQIKRQIISLVPYSPNMNDFGLLFMIFEKRTQEKELKAKSLIEKKSDIIDNIFKKKDQQKIDLIIKYFKKTYPNKRFPKDKIEEIYYDMTDNNHINQIYNIVNTTTKNLNKKPLFL